MRAEHFRRRRRRWFNVGRWEGRLATLASVLALVCFADWFASQEHHTIVAPQSPPSSHSNAGAADTLPFAVSRLAVPSAVGGTRIERIVYPYSVIPGGIRSVQELKNAIAKDSVVSAHYAAFHLADARIIKLNRELSVHVSYRLGDQVYWTKRELKLAKGETLITDGVQTARARCGNLISVTTVAPVYPTEPTEQELNTPQEPTTQVLDTPEDHPYTVSKIKTDDRIPEIVPPQGSPGPPVGGGSPPSLGEFTPVVFLPFGPVEPIPHSGAPRPPVVVNTPEPSTATLLLTALLALLFLPKRKPREVPKIVTRANSP